MGTKFFNSKVFLVLAPAIIGVIGTLSTQKALAKREDEKEENRILDEKLAKKADVSYVIQRDSLLQTQINTGKENCKELKENLESYAKETNENLREIRNYIMKGK